MTFFFLGFGPRDDEEAERQIAFDELGTKCVAMIHMVANRFVPKGKVIPSTAEEERGIMLLMRDNELPDWLIIEKPPGSPEV